MTHHLRKRLFETLAVSITCIISAGAMETPQISINTSEILSEQTEIMCNSEPGSESESSSTETHDFPLQLNEIEVICDSEAWNFAFEYYADNANSVQYINGEKTIYSQNQTLSTIKLSSPLSRDLNSRDCFFVRHMLNDIPTMKSDTYERGTFYFETVLPNIINGKLTMSFDPSAEKLNLFPYTFIK